MIYHPLFLLVQINDGIINYCNIIILPLKFLFFYHAVYYNFVNYILNPID